jgi:hypothetical protein
LKATLNTITLTLYQLWFRVKLIAVNLVQEENLVHFCKHQTIKQQHLEQCVDDIICALLHQKNNGLYRVQHDTIAASGQDFPPAQD